MIDKRLRFKDIKSRAGNFACYDCLVKSIFVNNASSCAVDDLHAIFHFQECFVIK